MVSPRDQEYGISILIADTLVRRVVNEKNIVRGKGRAPARIGEQRLGEDFHIMNVLSEMNELPRRELYPFTLILTQDIVGSSATPEGVLSDGFGIVLQHGGPH